MLTLTSTKSTDEESNSKTFRMYVNGELRNTQNRIGNRYDINTGEPIDIGSNSQGSQNFFRGVLDEIRIYNKALTDEQVATLYAAQSVQDVSASITISEGSTTGLVELKGKDDITDEPTELVTTKIISAVGATISDNKSASVVLTDDDETSVDITVSSNSIKEGTSQYATVTATLDKVSELPVTVYLGGSGVEATDYTFSLSNDTSSTIAALAAHYKFNGDAKDFSSNKNDGLISGAKFVPDRFGNENSALFFDGVNDFVEVSMTESLQIEDEITMNLWVNVEYSGDGNKVIYTYNDYYSFDINDGYSGWNGGDSRQFAWYARAAGGGNAYGLDCCYYNWDNGRAQQGEWYMITYSLTKEIIDEEIYYRYRGYYNGELLNDQLINKGNQNLPSLNSSLFIGAARQDGWENDYFKGILDDIRIYDGALTDEEISDIYSKEIKGETISLSNTIEISPGLLSSAVYIYAQDDDTFKIFRNSRSTKSFKTPVLHPMGTNMSLVGFLVSLFFHSTFVLLPLLLSLLFCLEIFLLFSSHSDCQYMILHLKHV